MNKHTPDAKALLRDSYKHGSSFFITESQKNPKTFKTYLLGSPLRNSLAPLLHNTLFSLLKEEVDDIIDSFRRVPGFTAELRFVDTVEFAGDLSRPYLVVGTIPDREPKTEAEILTKRIVETLMGCEAGPRKNQGVVLEMCYHPRVQTSFYQLAERNGWRVIPGTEAMIWQGVAQHILWTEKDQVFDDASTLSTIRGEIRDALMWRN
ncbi:hypothetical protein APSETT444_006995 [Aspergillus pseudonomiae]